MNQYRITITGIVQGVGFRPFVFNLAKGLSLKGWVKNVSDAVIIAVEGDHSVLEEFIRRLSDEAPVLSNIKEMTVQASVFEGYHDFKIVESNKTGERNIFISPDVSVCKDCIREMFDKNDRRFLYPFINCTNCGPRFTIVTGVPYDRIHTTMKKFPMCEKCASEYQKPSDRRYHAQPVSCFECGPTLELLDRYGNKVESMDVMRDARELLYGGEIIAVKGLGGYHLACHASNREAVIKLRKRKIRDDKPFALMVKDFETALRYAEINDQEKKLLESEKRPIVLLKRRNDCTLPFEIAPNNNYLGIMLPYTPVHYLLFHENLMDTLVMTSGNKSSEPIHYKDESALDELKDIADYFLINDREIFIRTDDSVTRVFKDREYVIRRARGYVPKPITCDSVNIFYKGEIPTILALGGELKNTFCLNRGTEFFISHHVGDLENAETLQSFEEGIEHFKKIFKITNRYIAYDLHPQYLSTQYALLQETEHKIGIQHHHAHIASCMAENNLNEDVIGVAFDGTGFGEDGHLWGGEFFTGSYKKFTRAAHLEYVKMPGGERAIKEPWRMAVSYLYKADPRLLNEGIKNTSLPVFKDIEPHKLSLVLQSIDKNINSPLTSSIGRLFDAVSALLGIRTIINYEGQAAIELEYKAAREQECDGVYSFSVFEEQGYKVCVDPMFIEIVHEIENHVPIGKIAMKFHQTLARIILDICSRIRSRQNLNKVVLSGGVFQNLTLLERSIKLLNKAGFMVYIHSKVPTNDGGISLGQGMIALARIS